MKRIISWVGINGFFAYMLWGGILGVQGAQNVVVFCAVVMGILSLVAICHEDIIADAVAKAPYSKTYHYADTIYDMAFLGTLLWFGWWVTAIFWFFIAVLSSTIQMERKKLVKEGRNINDGF